MIRQLVNAVRELLIKAVDPEANPDLAVLQEHVRHTDTVVILPPRRQKGHRITVDKKCADDRCCLAAATVASTAEGNWSPQNML